MKERPFSVALFFGVIWIVLPCLGNFVELPAWDNLNIGLCGLALILCICVYLTEYLGLFPLNYSKFSSHGEINSQLGWSICYGAPLVLYAILWYLSGMPQTIFQLVSLVTYLGHFLKRIIEALFIHKYSKNMLLLPVIEIAMFYCLGAVTQHYWCNIYTHGPLADKLSSNYVALVVGIPVFVIGESLNFYHHHILANLRPAGTLTGYVVPHAGLFHYLVCPHYLGELIAWYGMAVAGQHLGVYLAWLVMVCYLSGRSHQTHLWYLKKIENFPKDRRNIFPGIF
ncbi:unnamed protein product [Pocillopora meandrina]|uniref:3-oxo-5-alpha-steroid 4-dehydrogenase C-terminal domain-containing protein n=1 Tax=Pocillopora meandrina TaxID=46732 RepID=A0AAU9XKH9_9CNID|nr:unnamed protein product [Pocillopora meandrina]